MRYLANALFRDEDVRTKLLAKTYDNILALQTIRSLFRDEDEKDKLLAKTYDNLLAV